METAINRIIILNERAAIRLTNVLSRKLIPDLYRTISQLTEYDKSIKTNQKKARRDKENEDIRRLPIALAIVKLLQKLPQAVLTSYLPKLLLKVSGYLKSTTKSVRVYARDTLRKILVTLGTEYFEYTLDHLRAMLRRGFHVHVLSVTTFTLLDALKADFPKGRFVV
jgi:U3 small nucleolar RNA-associated protein 20